MFNFHKVFVLSSRKSEIPSSLNRNCFVRTIACCRYTVMQTIIVILHQLVFSSYLSRNSKFLTSYLHYHQTSTFTNDQARHQTGSTVLLIGRVKTKQTKHDLPVTILVNFKSGLSLLLFHFALLLFLKMNNSVARAAGLSVRRYIVCSYLLLTYILFKQVFFSN